MENRGMNRYGEQKADPVLSWEWRRQHGRKIQVLL